MKKLQYSYSTEYLHDLAVTKSMDGTQVDLNVIAMQEWLSKNVKSNKGKSYRWGRDKLYMYIDHLTPSRSGNSIITKKFSRKLFFVYEQDLLAFRIRFGINK